MGLLKIVLIAGILVSFTLVAATTDEEVPSVSPL